MIVKANAKINLTLDIVGKRNDGYHLLSSVFQSISLFDEIEIEKEDGILVEFSNSEVDAKNSIATKAAKAFFEYTKIKGGAKITVKNNIPTRSGMGGGSSDCAGVLVGLNGLFGANLTKTQLCEIGAKLGADVPFCIIGGTSKVEGIGDIIKPLPNLPTLNLVIIKYGEKLSTADMYRQLDSKHYAPPKTEKMEKAIRQGDKLKILDNISNAFLSVANIDFEEKLLKSCGAIKVGLSGSGPSVFGIFPDSNTSLSAFKKLKSSGYDVFCAETSTSGIIIE